MGPDHPSDEHGCRSCFWTECNSCPRSAPVPESGTADQCLRLRGDSWVRMGDHSSTLRPTPSWHEVDAAAVSGIGPLTRPLPLACRDKNWWWVPVVAPVLGAYLGGIIYVVFIGFTIPREPQILENPVEYEDHQTPVLPKTMPHHTVNTSLASVSVSLDNRTPVQPVPPLSDNIQVQQF